MFSPPGCEKAGRQQYCCAGQQGARPVHIRNSQRRTFFNTVQSVPPAVRDKTSVTPQRLRRWTLSDDVSGRRTIRGTRKREGVGGRSLSDTPKRRNTLDIYARARDRCFPNETSPHCWWGGMGPSQASCLRTRAQCAPTAAHTRLSHAHRACGGSVPRQTPELGSYSGRPQALEGRTFSNPSRLIGKTAQSSARRTRSAARHSGRGLCMCGTRKSRSVATWAEPE